MIRIAISVAVVGLIAGCVAPSQMMVNSQGKVMRCSASGFGVLGAPLAERTVSNCMKDLSVIGYIEFEKAGATGLQVSPVQNPAEPMAVRIVNVLPNSPAANAGILPEDRIIEVNGQPVTGVAMAANSMFGLKGEPVSFKVRRGNEEKSFTLVRVSRAVQQGLQ